MVAVTKGKDEVLSLVPEWRSRLSEVWPLLLLATLGLIWSASFWQHFVFPNSDYYTFVGTGRQWLSFEIPSTMKRAPVFSVIAGALSLIFSHPHVQLAATELYNALLLPVAMILFYFVGRDLLGRPTALVTAFLAGISPWTVRMSSEALAEMTLVVLFAAGVLCVARGRFGWAYLFAMLASITRWDLVGLVPAVALADVARNRKWRPMLVKASLAALPFLVCMWITKVQLAAATTGAHYLQVLSEERDFALGQDLRNYWGSLLSSVNASPYWKLGGKLRSVAWVDTAVFRVTAVVLAQMFLWGSLCGLVKRRWEILTMLATAVPYVLVHAVYPYRLGRFCVPVAWVGLVIAVYGAKAVVDFLRDRWPAWRYVKPVLHLGTLVLLVVWMIAVRRALAYWVGRKFCPGIDAVVFWSAAAAVVGYVGYEWVREARWGLRWLVVPAFLVLAVFSTGVQTALLMGDGRMLANFKTLSIWFKENARPDDKMVTNMPHYMTLYTGLPSERFVHTGTISTETARDLPGFVAACREKGVTLIAWDSGYDGNTEDRYYKLWGLGRLRPLGQPFTDRQVKKIGSCTLEHAIGPDWPRIAVWRITP